LKPRIEILEEKKLVGYHLKMSLINNLTGQLWGQFGPKIKAIKNRVSEDKISMQIYDEDYYRNFDPSNEFEKCATVEVENFNEIPEGMKSFILEEGTYAVFDYKGSSADNSIYQYIFWKWLPDSPYKIDKRPHFEVLGEKI